MDERTEAIVLRAMAITLGLVWIYILIVVIWKAIISADSFTGASDIGLLILIPASIWWFSREDERISLPRTMLGKELPTGLDEEAKKIRRISYITESIGLSLGWTILTILTIFMFDDTSSKILLFPNVSHLLNYSIIFGLELLIGSVLVYSLKAIDGEYTIKKYHQKLDELEKESYLKNLKD